MPVQVTKIRLDTRVLDRMAKDLDRNADRVIASIAHQVEAEAKQLAPVDTGALKNSLHTDREGQAHYIVADGVEYGIFQELGTSRMAAHPFMVPAVESVGRQINDRWGPLF